MKARCDNPNNTKYANYGGRGITYQSSWKNFEAFLRDMGDLYYAHAFMFGEKDTTLDRINSDRRYSKKNCRWATRAEQTRNRKTSVYYKGEYSCDASIRLGGDIDSVNVRMRHGWSLNKAFTTPFNKTRLMNKYKYKGLEMTVPELAKVNGLKPKTIMARIEKYGWTVARAVETPAKHNVDLSKTDVTN